ncbi:hypothetical protein BH09PSE2_BH09PSE2_12600 [soil metagenome]
MAIGRDMQRRFGDASGLPRLLVRNPAQLELVDAAMLRAQAAAAGFASAQGADQERAEALLVQSMLLREHGRRTGAAEELAKAADIADRAGRPNGGVPAEARLELALCALAAAELFGDAAALDAAQARLTEAEPAAQTAVQSARRRAAAARANAGRALASGDLDLAIAAAEDHDGAVDALDTLARKDATLRSDAALARTARAELLVGFALRLTEAQLAAQAADDLAQVSDRLDPDLSPLTFCRVETLRGEALCALGELTGDAASLAEGAAALVCALDAAPQAWSPTDRARAARSLGLARQALAEATDEPALYDQAAESFDTALLALADAPALPLRAACAFDRALSLARRAEHVGDARALAWAEGALKARLAAHDPVVDPVAWACLQVALARLYVLKELASGDPADRAHASLALESAVEVFTERGLKSLAEAALATAA